MKLALSLRILSLFFWWYLVVFVLSVLPLVGINLPPWTVPAFRGETYAWDFELLFTVIFVVWAIYLWKASQNLLANKTFIAFTIWATAAHILAMFLIGLIRPADLPHLAIDGLALTLPLVLVALGYKNELAGK